MHRRLWARKLFRAWNRPRGSRVKHFVTVRAQIWRIAGAMLIAGGAAMGSRVEPTQDLARTMAERVTPATTHAEALRELRTAFPESSLALRVAALAMLNRRGADEPAHSPR
jgi:hypothetical protein